ncbi:MAG TPA: hypothetical protein VF677_11895 [Flavobacterium sp.]|jgi:hypothetical protein
MPASRITITFTQDLPIGAQLGFDVVNDGGGWGVPTTVSQIFNWVNLRSANNQVTRGIATTTPGERSAVNFQTAFNLDTGGQYVVMRNSNEVTIVANNLYSLTEFVVNGIFAPYTNHPSIGFEITNGNSVAFAINSTTFVQAASSPCFNINIVITTNELATRILSPFILNGNTQNPFSFQALRGSSINVIIENADGEQINQIIEMPGLLNASNFSVLINNSPNGATAIIESTNTNGLTLEYSLDNFVWQTSNVFNGLVVGNYNLYIKDNFGCNVNRSFLIDEFGIQTPYFYISKSNSIRFANRINWGDSENYKTDENTLSCEVDVELPYSEIQQFQSADIITTQFKSNYSSNIATLVNEDGAIVNIPVEKKTSNIGIKDKRDCRKYNVGNGKTGIYFISGNIYDYNSNAVTGPYALNGLLPEWGEIGNYLQIANIWYIIEDIVFDETKNADVIVFSNTYIGSEVNVIAGSIYNRFNYEVYEFSIDMVDYIDEKFKVKLVNSNSNFTTITHLSETIYCKVKHENVLEIRYRNTTNTDIFYSTGIEHKIRIPYIKISGKSDEQSEVHKTDTDAILLNADMYEVDEFQFEPVTKEIWRKLMIALSHEKVLINGVGYVKNGSFSTEGPLDKTNLYVLTANMIKTGNVYNSQTSGNLDFDGSEVEVPGLISTESGYLRY